ncbi:MAG: TetR/AcrR family transcriptional regulator [Armatimonadota bacterium]
MKNTYRHGDLANALVLDALVLLEEKSAEELSLRDLAERAGVSPRAPYVHFPSKQHLLKAIAAKGFEDLTARSIRAGFDIEALGNAYVDFAIEKPHLFRLMFGGVYLTLEECTDMDHSFTHVLAAIHHHHPEMSDDEVRLSGLGLWAFVHGLADLTIERLITPVPLSALRNILARVLADARA